MHLEIELDKQSRDYRKYVDYKVYIKIVHKVTRDDQFKLSSKLTINNVIKVLI